MWPKTRLFQQEQSDLYRRFQDGPLYAWKGHMLKFPNYCISFSENRFSESTVAPVEECLTRDRGIEPHWRHCVVLLSKHFHNIIFLSLMIDFRERSGTVVDCLTRDRGPRVRASPALSCCARQIFPCLVLVQPRKTRPDITETLLTGT